MTEGTQDHGFIPLGKYSSARDSLLHFLVSVEWDDGDSFGDVSEWGNYIWKITNTPEDVAKVNTEFNSVIEAWLSENTEVTDSQALRDEIVGFFIVSTNGQGFISVEKFSTARQRDIQFALYLQSYEEFYAEDEEI
jgi:hypothetical protein